MEQTPNWFEMVTVVTSKLVCIWTVTCQWCAHIFPDQYISSLEGIIDDVSRNQYLSGGHAHINLHWCLGHIYWVCLIVLFGIPNWKRVGKFNHEQIFITYASLIIKINTSPQNPWIVHFLPKMVIVYILISGYWQYEYTFCLL